jgi:hypothetical protein
MDSWKHALRCGISRIQAHTTLRYIRRFELPRVASLEEEVKRLECCASLLAGVQAMFRLTSYSLSPSSHPPKTVILKPASDLRR